jgi:phenylpropionate dioxygenase-like ring-hydroxylating dioxygenase large terminal subunit
MSIVTDILTPAEIAAMTRPLESAFAPPPAWYTSPDLYALEMEHIFMHEWLWVGHAEDVSKPGDYFTFTYADEPILVTCDQTGELHAFSNVCTHRGAILASGAGNRNRFTCPYHTWGFGLDGALRAAPCMDEVKDFDWAQHGLRPLKVESWHGNILVNFDLNCRPLAASVGKLEDYFRNYDMGSLVCTSRQVHDIPCNWKMLVENNMEGYHFLGTHAAPGEYNNLDNWGTIDGEPANTFNILVARYDEPLTMNVPGSGEQAVSFIDGLTEEQLKSTYFPTLYPTSFWALQPDNVLCAHFVPDGVANAKWIIDYCFPEATIARPDFEAIEAAAVEGAESFVRQDHDVLEKTFRGYQSRGFRPGRLSLHERNVHYFCRWVLSRLPGIESAMNDEKT